MTLLVIPGLVAVAYAGLVVLLYLLQDRILFPATREVYRNPGYYEWAFEEVYLDVSREKTLLWFIPHDNPRGVVLFSHGNAGNIADRLESVGLLRSFGLSVAVYDYGGYGRSSGTPSEARACADARAAWTYLTETRGIAPRNIVLFGRSLGGAVTADLAASVVPAGVVLESTFLSTVAVARERYPWLPMRAILKHRFQTDQKLGNVEAPLLFIHSPEDTIIPFEHGRRLYKLAPDPKRFVEIQGDHNTGFVESEAVYRDAWESFLSDVLPAPSRSTETAS